MQVAGEKTLDDCDMCHGPPLSPVQYLGVKFDHSDALKRGVECRKCHIHVIQGNGEVSKDRCFSCHTESHKLEKYTDAILMHDNHVTKHKVDCLRCHDEIRHRILEMAQSVEMECTSCHPNQHLAQKELFLGVGGHDVEYMPDPMFLTRVSCTSCHISHQGDPFQGTSAYSNEAACMSCHGTQYGAILGQWKEQMKTILSVILPSLDKSRSELKKRSVDLPKLKEAERLVKEAQENVDLVRYGKGVHNIKYSVSLLSVANEKLTQAMKLIGSYYLPPPLPLSQASLRSECYSCHLDVEKKKTEIFGSLFAHQTHLQKANIGCERCHSNQRVHGELILNKQSCENCHHQEKKRECQKCHGDGPTPPIEYKSVDFVHDVHTTTLGMSCTDCHQRKNGKMRLMTDFDCYSCHHPLEEKECEDCHR